MASSASLKGQLDEKIREIEQAVSGISDEKASAAPAGEWCVKEVLSHLSGPETESFYDGVKRFLDEDTPEINLAPGDSYFGATRSNARADQLLADVMRQYRQVAEFVAGLSDDQLARKAQMPAFKETPLGEYPSLGLWVGAIINFHLAGHVQQLQQLCA
jgi:hypothetical protein